MNFPDEYRLPSSYPYTNGFKDKNDPGALDFVDAFNAIRQRILDGTMYIKFVDGDRKGSIAKITFATDKYVASAFDECKIVSGYSSWHGGQVYRFNHDRFYVVCSWDKRKNKTQLSVPHKEVIFLPNYTGPTVYEMFDHKAAKAEALASPDQYDIDGNLLNVGDNVVYINARYGSAFQLCHGTIKEFKAVVDSKKTEISTIVQEDGNDDMISTIANSSGMIYKKKV